MMEEAGIWLRIDPEIMPTMIHGATLSVHELEALRRIKDIVRLGRVRAIEPDLLLMSGGEVPAPNGSLYIDCTASALQYSGDPGPVFTEDRIGIQMVRLYQPAFSAAMIAKIESLECSLKEKNAMARPVDMTDSVKSWVERQIAGGMNQFAWAQHPDIKPWISNCRLDAFGRAARDVDRNDPEAKAIFASIQAHMMPSMANIQKLLAS